MCLVEDHDIRIRQKARTGASQCQIAKKEGVVDDQDPRMIDATARLIIKTVFVGGAISAHAVAAIAGHFIPDDHLGRIV